MFEQSEHLDLPGCEVRVWRRRGSPGSLTTWPKTPTMWSPFLSGTAADLECHPGLVGLKKNPLGSVTETAPMILRVKSSRA